MINDLMRVHNAKRMFLNLFCEYDEYDNEKISDLKEIVDVLISEWQKLINNALIMIYRNQKIDFKQIENHISKFEKNSNSGVEKNTIIIIPGRKDNMIISAGKNIYPEEIEQVLQTAEGVKEVLVRSVADDKGIEKFIAYIVTDDIEPDMKSLFEVCKNRLENYKIPSKFVYVKELEKTPSGKIVRKQQL